jgi:hypothetical protein
VIPWHCGDWVHLPLEVADAGHKQLLIDLGCTIGHDCKRHIGWWHFRPERGWQIVVEEPHLRLYDTKGCERLLFTNGDVRTLNTLTTYTIHSAVDWWRPDLGYVITTTIRNEVDDTVVARTYHLLTHNDVDTVLSRQTAIAHQMLARLISGK